MASLLDLDFGDRGRLDGKDAFDADAVGHLANREGRRLSALSAADHDALENLNPLFLPFADLDVDADGIAGTKRR